MWPKEMRIKMRAAAITGMNMDIATSTNTAIRTAVHAVMSTVTEARAV